MAYTLNLETITVEAADAIAELDRTFVGTPDYMGIAWFWNYSYRHYLRDASISQRRRVHQLLVGEGLKVGGESPDHEDIILSVVGR